MQTVKRASKQEMEFMNQILSTDQQMKMRWKLPPVHRESRHLLFCRQLRCFRTTPRLLTSAAVGYRQLRGQKWGCEHFRLFRTLRIARLQFVTCPPWSNEQVHLEAAHIETAWLPIHIGKIQSTRAVSHRGIPVSSAEVLTAFHRKCSSLDS